MKTITFTPFEVMLFDTISSPNDLMRFITIVDAVIGKAVGDVPASEWRQTFGNVAWTDLTDLEKLHGITINFPDISIDAESRMAVLKELAKYPETFTAALESLKVSAITGLGDENVAFLSAMGVGTTTVSIS